MVTRPCPERATGGSTRTPGTSRELHCIPVIRGRFPCQLSPFCYSAEKKKTQAGKREALEEKNLFGANGRKGGQFSPLNTASFSSRSSSSLNFGSQRNS